MAKDFNPFEHHHEHHHEAPLTTAEMDPAQRSLADALRVCFTLLKIAMLVVAVWYVAFSSWYNVRTNEKAVELFMGNIVDEEAIGEGGLKWSAPFPFGEVVRIPTSDFTFEMDNAFWYDMAGAAPGAPPVARPLNPERDGSNVTGDANIVHTRWVVTYYVKDPIAYVKHLGRLDLAQTVVRNASEQAVVHTLARLTADQVMKAEGYKDTFLAVSQRALNTLQTGIEVRNVTMTKYEMPGSVREAYNAVTKADTSRQAKITDAEKEASMIVRQVAGEAYTPLWELIRAFEDASDTGDQAKMADLGAKLDAAFINLTVETPTGPVPIGGQVAELINDANVYRTQVVEQVKGEADRFAQLLPHYKNNPEIVISRLWTEAKQAALSSGSVESIYTPPGRTVLELNRDPEVGKRREAQRVADDQERRRREAIGAPIPSAP